MVVCSLKLPSKQCHSVDKCKALLPLGTFRCRTYVAGSIQWLSVDLLMTVHWPTIKRLRRWFWWEWVSPLEPSSQHAFWRWIRPPLSLGRSCGLQASSISDHYHLCRIWTPVWPRWLLGFIPPLFACRRKEHLEQKPKLVRMCFEVVRNRWTSTRNCRNQHGRTFGGLTHPLESTWQLLNMRFVGLKKPMHNSLNSWQINQTTRTEQSQLSSSSFKRWLYLLDRLICPTRIYTYSLKKGLPYICNLRICLN